jgi:hypothetical protein
MVYTKPKQTQGSFSCDICHDFPAHKKFHTIRTADIAALNVMWNLALT